MTDINPEVSAAITKAIRIGVKEGTEAALISMGVDVNNPIGVQKDLAFLHKQREASEQVSKYTKRIVWGSILSGLITILILGVKTAVEKV